MSDEQPKAPVVAKYDPVFARMENERTKLRQAGMAKFYEPYGRFIYGNEAIAARMTENLYVSPDCWEKK